MPHDPRRRAPIAPARPAAGPGLTRRRCLGWCAVSAAAGWWRPAAAQPLLLVTADEVARDAAAAPVFTPRAAPVPDAPRIRVIAPALAGAPIGNPIRIDLAFVAAPDAEIDPASFRIQYGALRLDVTDRLLARVRVLKTGLQVDQVAVPPGNHRLLLRIADTKGRQGEADLRFSVQ